MSFILIDQTHYLKYNETSMKINYIQVYENVRYASSIRQLKNKLFTYEDFQKILPDNR